MVSAYEQQRLTRILQNKRKLEELGLLDDDVRLPRKTEVKQVKQRAELASQRKSSPAKPQRRSNRLQGLNAPVPRLATSPRLLRSPGKPVSTLPHVAQADAQHDRHNRMRLKSMGADAMRRRIFLMQNVAKISSFIRVCIQDGYVEFAELAKQRFKDLTGSDVL